MTKRGQNPYSSNSSSGFSNSNSMPSSTPAYDQRSSTYSQIESDRNAALVKPTVFKSKGMQLGSKGKQGNSVLEQALGGLSIDEPLMERRIEREEEVHTPQSEPITSPPGKEINPFGEVEEAE